MTKIQYTNPVVAGYLFPGVVFSIIGLGNGLIFLLIGLILIVSGVRVNRKIVEG